MIPKPGKDHKNPSDHRLVSLLNTLAKILKTTIFSRLKLAIIMCNIRPGHSTTNQLLKLINYLTNKINRYEKTTVLFLDFVKAFDKVWCRGLIHKLITLGVNIQLIKIINSFLTKINYSVRVLDVKSTSRYMEGSRSSSRFLFISITLHNLH